MALGEDGRQHGEPPCAVERPGPSELTGFRRFDADPEATIAMPVAAPPPAPAERFAAGETIDHYEIIRPLGRGGMSDVYLARDTRLGRRVALKFLSQVDPQQAARFEVEARTTAQLVHENIVTLHDVGEHRGLPYMVLEHVPGKTLAAWLRERREEGSPATVPPARAAEMMLPVARALRCAHAAGIVHRDLKPSNIMLADSGTVKVLDFGIAKLVGAPAAARSRHPTRPPAAPPETTSPAEPSSEAVAGALTQVGTVLGTHAYMAPEQWWSEPIDGRTDLWAVGVILYLMVRGEHPLGAVSSDLLLSAALHREVPMPSALEQAPEVGALGALIDRCLVKDPVDRLGSADELCAVLEAIARPHAAGRPEDESPYSGLAAFQERDAGRFFGRERVIEQISSRLADQPLLALLGPSGAGKSSLVRAGVIPALKRGGEAWETFVLRPGPRPLLSLAELLLQHVGQRTGGADHATGDPAPPSGRDAASTLAQRLRLEPGLFGAELRGRARRRRERALLFVDQFEEVYTLASEDEREAFCASLSGAADDAASPLRVMVALRHDFLDRVAASASALSDLIGRGTVLLAPLDPPALRRALVEPAEALGYRFESEALVDEMLASLADTASALPILQFTAAKLWEGRDRARRVLTEASYRAFGGVGGALASHADSVLGTLNSMERRSARALFLHLVTPERTRAIATRRELGSLGAPEGAPTIDRVLARLVEARLVTVGGAGEDESTVELLHESLIQAWPTLAGWLSEAEGDAQIRTRLAAAAREWEASGRPEGLLWRGEAAQEARRWQARHAEADAALLSAREARFLAALLALGDRERRRRRQLLGGLFAALVLVVFVVSALAVRSNRAAARALAEQLEAQARRADAERSRADAEQSAARARNATRLAAARERQADPTLALALLREIEPGAPPRGWAEFARWAAEAGVSLEVHPHDAPVRGVAVSPDGQRYASAAWDKTVRVFRADGKGEPLVLRGHEDRVFSVAFSPDGRRVVSASGDKTVRVFRADGTGEPLVLRGHDALVYAAAFSPDGQRIVSASGDKTVRVSRADGKGEPLVLRGHEGGVYAAAWSPDGRRVVTGGGDKTVRLWSADGKGEPLVLRGHEDGVFAVAFSPDGKRVAAGSLDRTLRVWRADGEGAPVIVRGHGGGVYGVAFSPDGRRLVTASVDKTLSVHDADGKGQPLVLRGHADGVYAAAFTPDGRHVISGSWDKTVRVWSASPAAGQPVVLRGHDDSVYTAAMSPDGRRLASASWDKTVRVWDPAGVEPPRVLRGHEAGVYSAAFDPEGRRLVSASWDKTVRIWDLAETAPPLVLRGHEDAVYGAAFSPDGRRVVSASLDKTVRVWSADGKGEPLVLRGHDAGVYGAAFSPDGLAIASASIDKTVRVWSADGKGEPRILRGHEDAVYGVAWSPDGRRIATASLDKTVRVWSADGKGEPRILRGHEAPASVRGERAWSPDGARLVSSSDDATVRVWSADGEGEPLILRASSAALNSASWSPDGRQLLAASDDGTIVLWSDLVPLRGADDRRLWSATRYCPSPELRERLLGFSPPQSRADLERCQQRVREAHAEPR